MKSPRWPSLLQGGLLLLPLLVLAYWAWDRHHRPSVPAYEGKTLPQWVEDLRDPDYFISDRAADALANAGADAVPILLEARKTSELRLHRRVVAVLVRIGEPAAPGLVAELHSGPNEGVETALVRLGPKAVPALTETLPKEKAGKEAARVLGLMGPRAAAAVPALLAALKQRPGSAGVREESAEALGRIGTPASDIVPALVAALKDEKPRVRQRAADALIWIGPRGREAVPALVAALKDERPETASTACLALGEIGDASAAPALLEAFQGKQDEIAQAAAMALWRLAPNHRTIIPALLPLAKGEPAKTVRARALLVSLGPLAVPPSMAALSDGDAALRQAAAEVLGAIGPPAREAVPLLVGALKDNSPPTALAAALALAAIDPTRAREAVPLLADSLDTPGAAEALAEIGPDARAAVPALIAALKPRPGAANDAARRGAARYALARIGAPAADALREANKEGAPDVARQAAETLGWILPPRKDAVPILRAAMRQDRAHAGDYALALGQIGPTAREAVPELTDLLTDPAARPRAAVALVRIDPEQAKKVLPLLVADLKASDDKRRLAAAAALELLGSAAQPAAAVLAELTRDNVAGEAALAALAQMGPAALPVLLDMLKDPNPAYRLKAIGLLIPLGRGAREAVGLLRKSLADPVTEVRAGAAHVLAEIGPPAGDAVPYLLENLTAWQPEVRSQSAMALGHIGPSAQDALRPLRECLLDPDTNVRYAAALSLGRIDPHFVEAEPALRDALHDQYPEVRLAAIDSLSHIDGARVEELVPILLELSGYPYYAAARFKAAEGLVELAPQEAKAAAPMLTAELYGENVGRRLNAAVLLARIDPARLPAVVLALAAALKDRNPANRQLIARALGNLGSKAREAVPFLLPLLQDGVPAVRKEAAEALRGIDPPTAKRLGVGS